MRALDDFEWTVAEGCVSHEKDGLRPLDPGGAVLDAFELEEQLVGVPAGPAAVFAAVVGEHGGDLGTVALERRQDVVVQEMHHGHWQLGGVEPPPGVS